MRGRTAVTIETLPKDLSRWVSMLAPSRQLAEVIADTEFVPKGMRGKPDVVTAAIMYGDELGLGPMQALAGLDVVEGKPRPSAELARALILRDGHTIAVHDATGSRVRVSGLRAGRPESERVTVEWTMDMARAAGLVNKQNWRNYPRAMLMARATGDLARILFPDVIKGLGYVAETDDTATTMDGWVVEDIPREERPPVAPATKAIQRKPRGGVPAPGSGESPHGSPELPPESVPGPDPDGQDTPPERITDPQRRALFGAMGKAFPDASRTERLALCSAIRGREVGSSNDLGPTEASVILDWMDGFNSGWNGWDWDPDAEVGHVFRRDTEPPPTPDGVADPWS
jgi:hypothetical protein